MLLNVDNVFVTFKISPQFKDTEWHIRNKEAVFVPQ